MTTDGRAADYQKLHADQLSTQERYNRGSAKVILGIIRNFIEARSLLDVGCGIGTWINAAAELGITDVRGIEGPWFKRENAVVPPDLIQTADLEKPIALNRRFDLVLCLEVAEHLPATAADTLVSSLTSHADHVLFSAAIPSQGGTHHVNEQFLTCWVDLFKKHDYALVDLVRPRVWDNADILWWLRQNAVLFVKRDALRTNPALTAECAFPRPIDIVHPEFYSIRVNALQEEIDKAKKFVDTLVGFKTPVTISRLPDGRIGVTVVEPPAPPAPGILKQPPRPL